MERTYFLWMETNEEKMNSQKFHQAFTYLKNNGILDKIQVVIFGKKIDEMYVQEYQKLFVDVISKSD